MIIRKPYAFLIRHFRKIHILLFALCCFVYYKNLQLSSFLNEFIKFQTYDSFTEPIGKYVSLLVILSLLIIIIGSLLLSILLRHKKKPWKLYLLPIIEYTMILLTFIAAKGFFDSYTGNLETATIRAIRDFLTIATILQYPVLIVFLIRILGVDINKFNFQLDKEYLELNQDDREELEINIEFDKNSIKREIKKFIRNFSYFCQEHKIIVGVASTILVVLLVYNSYQFIFVTHKSYKEGQSLDANGYTITLNSSYYTDKDYTGNVISELNSFVVLDLTIVNNYQIREIDFNKFHLMNGISNYVTTAKTYGTEFQDFGKTYESKELRNNEKLNLIMVFRVDKKLSPKRFVLYYQEFDDKGNPNLRKIKIKMNNVTEIEKQKKLELGDELNFKLKNKEESIIFDQYEFLDKLEYSYRVCNSSNCKTKKDIYEAPKDKKILKISFASNNFEGKDMIDFSTKYGKISYIDNKNKRSVIKFKNPLNRVYYGKYLYTLVPSKMTDAKSIELTYIIRNKEYKYKIR